MLPPTLPITSHHTPFALAAALLLLLTLPLTAQQQTNLTQLYVPGMTYHLELVSSNETRPQTPPDTEQTPPTITTNITQNFDLKTSSKDSHTLVNIHQTSLTASILANQELQTTYDSANPALSPPLLQQLFGASKERTFTLVYDNQHHFVKINASTANDPTPLGKQSAFTTQQFAEAFRLMRDGLLPTPEQNKNLNNTWQINHLIHLPPLGQLQLKATATLAPQLNPDQLQPITIEGTLEIATSTAPDTTTFTISNAKFTGQLLFDPSLHQTKSLQTTTSLTLHQPDQPDLHFQQKETLTLRSITTTTTEP